MSKVICPNCKSARYTSVIDGETINVKGPFHHCENCLLNFFDDETIAQKLAEDIKAQQGDDTTEGPEHADRTQAVDKPKEEIADHNSGLDKQPELNTTHEEEVTGIATDPHSN